MKTSDAIQIGLTEQSLNISENHDFHLLTMISLKCVHFQYTELMRGSRKVCQRGSNFDNVFNVLRGERGSKQLPL